MARFGHPVLFPHQNDSVAVMSSKIDQFESFQVRLLIHRMFECLENRRITSVCCTAVCVLAEPADAHLVSGQLPRRCLTPSSTRPCSCPLQEILYFGKGKAAEKTREYYQRPINVTGAGGMEVRLTSPASACLALLPSSLQHLLACCCSPACQSGFKGHSHRNDYAEYLDLVDGVGEQTTEMSLWEASQVGQAERDCKQRCLAACTWPPAPPCPSFHPLPTHPIVHPCSTPSTPSVPWPSCPRPTSTT